ncbi:alpha-amylase family glycosyl hydrolase, partial [Streptomyces murinus]|uniref:alpha-amylase family glycosyl hydrolase n=1 Tax=Streptomyces murinus TaxID=33900 RepID=UPI003F465623
MTSARPGPGVPTATYRLQLQPAFPFSAAAAAVPYLASLGVSHLHLSPVLEAVPGSTHGYDVVDHTCVRAELGGEEGLRALSRTAREHGLGLVLDIVPNHMAMAPGHNRALWEVLREGPESARARWFDIDWDAGGGRVLLPVLGGPLGAELEHLRIDGDTLRLRDQVLPLRAGTAGLPLPELLDAQWYRPVCTTGQVHIAGEVTTAPTPRSPSWCATPFSTSATTPPPRGSTGPPAGYSVSIGAQSPDIAQGVDSAYEARAEGNSDELSRQGAGDQGLMFGYACDDTPALTP